jgi:uncharacterized Zn-finger protein
MKRRRLQKNRRIVRGSYRGPVRSEANSDFRKSRRLESMSGSGYLKFRNDRGIPEISIGVREFECIGESPPQDHPHVYINMGEAGAILCPYCGTRFRFDSGLTPGDAAPPDSLFADQTAA